MSNHSFGTYLRVPTVGIDDNNDRRNMLIWTLEHDIVVDDRRSIVWYNQSTIWFRYTEDVVAFKLKFSDHIFTRAY